MKIYEYIKDKAFVIIFQIVALLVLTTYLSVINVGRPVLLIIIVVWILVASMYFLLDCHMRKSYFDNLFHTLEQLEKKYLISDIMEQPKTLEDVLYKRILRAGNKAMLEEITRIKHERMEYKEYIEKWIHDVKTPIAAVKLICENNRNDTSRKILQELEKIDNYVEQALFYARSETVEQDYFIKEVELLQIVHAVMIANKQLLTGNRIQIQIDCKDSVYTDSKWILFIFSQIITNSVKYGAKTITFTSKKIGNTVELSILDDGIGISAEDRKRIFDKGFTGKNGHTLEKSTGIGLYLSKKLCDKLGIDIEVETEEESYTKISFLFSAVRNKSS